MTQWREANDTNELNRGDIKFVLLKYEGNPFLIMDVAYWTGTRWCWGATENALPVVAWLDRVPPYLPVKTNSKIDETAHYLSEG